MGEGPNAVPGCARVDEEEYVGRGASVRGAAGQVNPAIAGSPSLQAGETRPYSAGGLSSRSPCPRTVTT
jgi:hypothetical protein